LEQRNSVGGSRCEVFAGGAVTAKAAALIRAKDVQARRIRAPQEEKVNKIPEVVIEPIRFQSR
jgi:hypothetical protein